MKLPERMTGTAASIYRLHESRRDEEPRPYLGASEIGEACQRRLWLQFRWVSAPTFDGRMLRLFDTGQREEERVLDELRAIGVTVEGEQHEVMACGGHFSGHMDAAVLGLPEAPGTWHVIDVKTAKASKFAEMKKKGAGAVYPKYVAQLQVYMGLTGMERAALIIVCKDTDEIAVERLHFDGDEFDRLIARAKTIIDAPSPPLKISEDPTWYECRYCPFYEHCHGTQAPLPNCRTCAHSTPRDTGAWHCDWHDRPLGVDEQRSGCDDHRPLPALVESFLELVEAEGNVITWRNKLIGAQVKQPDYLSREIHAATDKKFLGDDFVKMMKTTFPGARVVESEAHLTWQTFKNGTRHIRREVAGQFAGYLEQTPDNLAAIAAQGDRAHAGPASEIEDDLPWMGTDDQDRVERSANGVATPGAGARRGSCRVSDVPQLDGRPVRGG